jgi:hypothetical protein
VKEICTLIGYYAAYSGNSVPTFRYNLSVPSSRVKPWKENEDEFFLTRLTLEGGITVRCVESQKSAYLDRTIVWRLLLGACVLIHIFVYKGKY